MTISNTDDIIDVREVIERIEELRDEISDNEVQDVQENNEQRDELKALEGFLEQLKGGGDHEWEGEWYGGIPCIREDHFEDYARELAEDCGMINKDTTWPNNCIDWERAARELQMDYTTADFDGVTYYWR